MFPTIFFFYWLFTASGQGLAGLHGLISLLADAITMLLISFFLYLWPFLHTSCLCVAIQKKKDQDVRKIGGEHKSICAGESAQPV